MATNKHPFIRLTRAWLRWFGSGPNIVGASLALVCVIGALLGMMETKLRLRFDTWWWVVVVAAYWAGWLLTSIVIWLIRQITGNQKTRSNQETDRSWVTTVYRRLDTATINSLNREWSAGQRRASAVVLIVSVGLLLFALLGADQTSALVALISALGLVPPTSRSEPAGTSEPAERSEPRS